MSDSASPEGESLFISHTFHSYILSPPGTGKYVTIVTVGVISTMKFTEIPPPHSISFLMSSKP